jgi:DNA-directed RNA polymerase subunit RPC12/RpoP
MKAEFKCSHCGESVFLKAVGTRQRNHCPFCLRSKHVDLERVGDRRSECRAEMEPIGLTFKNEGMDKYGKARQGELMLIHKCVGCGKISLNRIAGDDNSEEILKVFQLSQKMNSDEIERLKQKGINVLSKKDKEKILIQLFGRGLREHY